MIDEGFSANTKAGYNLIESDYSMKDMVYTTVMYEFKEKMMALQIMMLHLPYFMLHIMGILVMMLGR